MSTPGPLTESSRGYLSEASKRRFTIVAGLLGAAFFLAQFLLPMAVMLVIMLSMMSGELVSFSDVDQATLWHGELWVPQRTEKVNWRDPEDSKTAIALRRIHSADLSVAGPEVPLGLNARASSPALLPIRDRLWVIEADQVGYYSGGSLTRFRGVRRPRRASRPFLYEGRPSVVTLGAKPVLATLSVTGSHAEWSPRPLSLHLPEGARSIQALETSGGLFLIAESCTEEPEQCSLLYRLPDGQEWLPLSEDLGCCNDWTAVTLAGGPAVVVSRREKGGEARLAVVTLGPGGPRSEEITSEKRPRRWARWHALSKDGRLLLVSEGMPGNLRLGEVVNGRLTVLAETEGGFPFGRRMMWLMFIPQLLPMLLSLLLAVLLTAQMRRHRIGEYAVAEKRRTFASLWQRALAQLIDLVPLCAGFVLPAAFMWKLFSDPEEMVESGLMFPVWFFGLFAAAALAAVLVLVAYSYFEGRFGKTPGKLLLRIRVLGTDLQPCGFGRALLRNLLTLVDGFFSFLVGAMLVALTENWQRLGDLAARTIVVVDEKRA